MNSWAAGRIRPRQERLTRVQSDVMTTGDLFSDFFGTSQPASKLSSPHGGPSGDYIAALCFAEPH